MNIQLAPRICTLCLRFTDEGVYNTYVLDSDYKSWALLMHCAEQSKTPRYLSSFIMSRQSSLGANVISYLREKLPRWITETQLGWAGLFIQEFNLSCFPWEGTILIWSTCSRWTSSCATKRALRKWIYWYRHRWCPGNISPSENIHSERNTDDSEYVYSGRRDVA